MVSDQLLSVSVELSFCFLITAVSAKVGRCSASAVQAQCKRSASAVERIKGALLVQINEANKQSNNNHVLTLLQYR
jgi:hypothetical protein